MRTVRHVTVNRPRSTYQYFNMALRLSGQNCKIFKFLYLSIPERDLDAKKTTPNIEVCPESHGAMWSIDATEVGIKCSTVPLRTKRTSNMHFYRLHFEIIYMS